MSYCTALAKKGTGLGICNFPLDEHGNCEMAPTTLRTSSMSTDAVNHPDHYGGGDNPYEAIKVIEAWGLNFSLGSAVKYVSRHGKKPGENAIQDLRKAAWYIIREADRLEKEAEVHGPGDTGSGEEVPLNSGIALSDELRDVGTGSERRAWTTGPL